MNRAASGKGVPQPRDFKPQTTVRDTQAQKQVDEEKQAVQVRMRQILAVG